MRLGRSISVLGICLAVCVIAAGDSSRGPGAWLYRGVCYDADWENRSAWYGTAAAEAQLKHITSIGVNAISVTPFAYQKDVHQPSIRFRETLDPGLEADIFRAKGLGMKVALKPHIWSNQFWDGSGNWHGTIAMQSERSWEEWFANYERMVDSYARHAQRLKVDLFVIGLEYVEATRGRREQWARIIRSVRGIYSGRITYAAHGFNEKVPFWDLLDVIGINAYFPLSDTTTPTREQLLAAWRRHRDALATLSRQNGGKPIIFTEIGYSSIDGTARRPFLWPARDSHEDMREQAECYDAFFTAMGDAPWFQGLFIWKFKVGVQPAEASHEPSESYIVFQGKPAEAVIQRHLTGR